VPIGVYRRSALDEVGGFASDMLFCEDEELNWRLRKAGYDILLEAGLRFRYLSRSSWRGVYRQHRRYGMGRARVIATHRRFLRPHHLVPSLFVCCIGTLSVSATMNQKARPALAACVGIYSLSAVAASLVATRSTDFSLAPSVAACFAAQHVGYGVGVLTGSASMMMARIARRTHERRADRRRDR
jgi:cellulose synthase/poly-beta-1,6-N-acetylglucosamine synthase-like glycosyltransferase